MQRLNIKAFGGLILLIVILAAALFIPARTLHYWQAWVFLGVFSVIVFAITMYLLKKDPKLLERRVNAGPMAEKEKNQKILQFIAQLAFIALIILPAIDHRYKWSALPFYAAIAGDALVLTGLLIVFFVFRENTFTSAIIEVGTEQKVVSTGPYSLVRHPMYMGALIMLLGTPVALGSWWGLLTVIPLVIIILLRLLDEEKFLAKNLSGYLEYQNKVRYRLIPFVW